MAERLSNSKGQLLRERAQNDPNSEMRIRAAWLYYVEGNTQSDVAKKLGVSRIMITRMLSEAKRRGEVVIQIKSKLTSLVQMQTQLEEKFGLHNAILAPLSDIDADPTRAIAAAAGEYVSGLMHHNVTVGVGWGRTLHSMLPYIEGRVLEGARIVSLLGGIAQARRFNPAEFAWQFAELFDAEGFLIPAPAIVDSPQTKHALLEHCGLDRIISMADACDIALLSCGGITSLTTSYRAGHISEADRASLMEAGAVGDLLYNFLDINGTPLDHPVNTRNISASTDRIARLPNKVLVSGGSEKLGIIRATLKAVKPKTLITDEVTGAQLIDDVS